MTPSLFGKLEQLPLDHPISFTIPTDRRITFVMRGKGRKLMSFNENMNTVIAMTDFLPREVRAELDAQRRRDLKGRSRIRVQAGDAFYPVLRLSGNSFTLDADEVTHLRGLVDLFDGAHHVRQCLIIASDVVSGELVCTMKWSRTVSETAPLDYERDENAPKGYLPRF